jgi:hypothetical protein
MNTLIRQNTSASNIARRKLCLGSARMEDGIAGEDTEHSAEGVLLHSLFMTGRRPTILTVEQVEVLSYADSLAEKFLANFREGLGIPEDAEFIVERETPRSRRPYLHVAAPRCPRRN